MKSYEQLLDEISSGELTLPEVPEERRITLPWFNDRGEDIGVHVLHLPADPSGPFLESWTTHEAEYIPDPDLEQGTLHDY